MSSGRPGIQRKSISIHRLCLARELPRAVSSIGSGTIGALLHLSQYHVTAPAAVFNFLAASLFWYAAHKGGRSAHKIYLSRMRTSTFLAVPFGCFATSMVLLHVLPEDHFLGFFISIFPPSCARHCCIDCAELSVSGACFSIRAISSA